MLLLGLLVLHGNTALVSALVVRRLRGRGRRRRGRLGAPAHRLRCRLRRCSLRARRHARGLRLRLWWMRRRDGWQRVGDHVLEDAAPAPPKLREHARRGRAVRARRLQLRRVGAAAHGRAGAHEDGRARLVRLQRTRPLRTASPGRRIGGRRRPLGGVLRCDVCSIRRQPSGGALRRGRRGMQVTGGVRRLGCEVNVALPLPPRGCPRRLRLRLQLLRARVEKRRRGLMSVRRRRCDVRGR